MLFNLEVMKVKKMGILQEMNNTWVIVDLKKHEFLLYS